MNRLPNWSGIVGLVIWLAAILPLAAQAYDLDARWQTFSPTGSRVIPMYDCPQSFVDSFQHPSNPYPIPYDRIRYSFVAAANTLFVNSGADVRIVYKGGLGPSDLRCTSGYPNPGELIVRGLIAPTCDAWVGGMNAMVPTEPGNPPGITWARVTANAGRTNCNGNPGIEWINWGDGINAGGLVRTFKHEFLHALGYALGGGHPPEFASNGVFVGKDDRDGLRANYGAVQTTPQALAKEANGMWGWAWGDPGAVDPVIGSPGLCYSTSGSPVNAKVLVAETRAADKKLRTYLRGEYGGGRLGWLPYVTNVVVHNNDTTFQQPALACNGNGGAVLAWVDDASAAQGVKVKSTNDHGATWSATVTVSNANSIGPIAVAHVPWNGSWVLGVSYVDPYSSNARLATFASLDGGSTWGNMSILNFDYAGVRMAGQFGITCRDGTEGCMRIPAKSISDSAPCRSPVPGHADHLTAC